MKEKWISGLGILSLLIIGLPSYAHAQGQYGDTLTSMLVSLLILLVVFLIFREVVCWYWKMNETVSLLKEIRDLLKTNSLETNEEPEYTKDIVDNTDGTFTVMGRTFKERKDAEALLDMYGSS
jgi:hypothetical protein